MNNHRKSLLVFLMVFCLNFSFAERVFAWGKRGHEIVARTAAYLLADTKGMRAGFLRAHAFDLGYYANVPDLVWRAPRTEKAEKPQHYMDWEIFERSLPKSEFEDSFALSRERFDAHYPKIAQSAGRSWWRIRELDGKLAAVTKELLVTGQSRVKRQDAQLRWLTLAGVIGHYVGDLAQPLHTTENYDGEMTGQKGVHATFETRAVDAQTFVLEEEVFAAARKAWPGYHASHATDSVLVLLRALTADSHKLIGDVLAIDKKVGRRNVQALARADHDLLVARLSTGALALAEIWSRHLGWRFDGFKFYRFSPVPDYVWPGSNL